MAWLVVEDPTAGGRRLPLGDRALLGRESGCTLWEVLAAHPRVSRRHASIEQRADGFYVEDLGSRHGTDVNGERLRDPVRLQHGDRVTIGGVDLRFEEPAPMPAACPPEVVPGPEELESGGILSRRKVRAWRPGEAFAAEIGADRKLRALVQMLGNVGRSLDADEMLDHLLSGLFEIFPQADRGFVGTRLTDGEPVTIRRVKLRDEEVKESPLVSQTIVDRVLRDQEAILSLDAQADDRFQASLSVTVGNIRSVMCAPLLDEEGKPFGVLELDALSARKHFRPEDLEVFACVAPQAAITLGFARLHQRAMEHQALEQDLSLARRVQQALLPACDPEVQGYDFHAFYEAAYQVGGDYYDYVPLSEDRWAILIADAFGKGVAASLLATKLSSELRTHLSTSPTPAEALHRMSRSLAGLSEELPCRFVTLALLVLDPRRHTLESVNAGHLVPLLRRASGTVEEIGRDVRGPALGMFPDLGYRSVTTRIEPGDVVMVCSDGFSEAMDASGSLFGMERLRETLARCAGSACEQGAAILREVQAFVAGERQSDDMCLLCIGRGEDSHPRASSRALQGGRDGARDPGAGG